VIGVLSPYSLAILLPCASTALYEQIAHIQYI
jgi:hypothetical protein